MEVTGTIIAALEPQSGISARSGNAWMKQDYVIEVPGQWPKRVAFNIFGEDRIKQFGLRQGEERVTIQFDIDAHEHEGRWYNEIRCYNVLRAVQAGATNAPAAQPAAAPAAAPFPPEQPAPQGSDDLPF